MLWFEQAMEDVGFRIPLWFFNLGLAIDPGLLAAHPYPCLNPRPAISNAYLRLVVNFQMILSPSFVSCFPIK
jgi:hypothetical protein